VIAIGEKCQQSIAEVEEMREARAPLQKELNELLAMKEDLLKRKRPFDKQNVVNDLEAALAKLPPWPVYAEVMNYHQYDNLSLEIVREMTSAILDNKKTLEDNIARMIKDNPPETIDHKKIEKDRQEIQSKIKHLTKHCLDKFGNPVFLLKFASDMKNRKETEIVREVVGKCLLKIKEITKLRAQRKPIQKKYDELEQAEAKDPKKKLSREHEKEKKTT
jgi:hypothetical protein